ncbi:MAG: replication-relaxation family protein [Candidatus Zixiibacteriota bacterium]
MSKTKIHLSTKDCDILRYLYDYRFLNAELLWHLLTYDNQTNSAFHTAGKRPLKYGFGRQALYKRLRGLYVNGYIERHYLTDLPFGRGYGRPRAIYGLGKQSAKILQEFEGIPAQDVRRMVTANRIKNPFLRHALELATFRVIVELACRKSKGRIGLLFWEQGRSIGATVYGYNIKGKKEKLTVYPDAFFGLQISNKKNRHFFLEIDRGTEPIISQSKRANIRRKLLAYQAYYSSKRLSQVQFGKINGFQVLIVTPGEILDDNTISGRISNILEELLSNKQTYTVKSLFLLTIPGSFKLENPENIFSSIWVCPKSPDELVSLIG